MIYSPAPFKRKLGFISLALLASLPCANHGFAMDDDQRRPKGKTTRFSQSLNLGTTEIDWNKLNVPSTQNCGTSSFPTQIIQQVNYGPKWAFRPANKNPNKPKTKPLASYQELDIKTNTTRKSLNSTSLPSFEDTISLTSRNAKNRTNKRHMRMPFPMVLSLCNNQGHLFNYLRCLLFLK